MKKDRAAAEQFHKSAVSLTAKESSRMGRNRTVAGQFHRME